MALAQRSIRLAPVDFARRQAGWLEQQRVVSLRSARHVRSGASRRQERFARRNDPASRRGGSRVPGGFATTAFAFHEFIDASPASAAHRRGACAARCRRCRSASRAPAPRSAAGSRRRRFRAPLERRIGGRLSAARWRSHRRATGRRPLVGDAPRTCPMRPSPGSRKHS